MSKMMNGRALRDFLRQYASDERLHIVTGGSEWDEEEALPESEAATVRAEVVEGLALEQKDIAPLPTSGFTHFLDGIQKKARGAVFYWRGVPLIRGFCAACVRMRGTNDRLMRTDPGMLSVRDAVYLPMILPQLDDFPHDILELIDSTPADPRQHTDLDNIAAVRSAARDALGKTRAELENDLAAKWMSRADGQHHLLVDGSLPPSVQQQDSSVCFGIIKSHQTRYFTGDEYQKVITLPVNRRTSVFKVNRGHGPVYSWYLRLRDFAGQDMNFGLVRVEATATARTIERADLISSWILAERTPLSLPDSRWDRMIYPIRDCEMYLNAVAPSRADMEARVIV